MSDEEFFEKLKRKPINMKSVALIQKGVISAAKFRRANTDAV